jgi:hypothetical protein
LTGPDAAWLLILTPSTYMSGSFDSERLAAPRMRMREPVPTLPLDGLMKTPGARAFSIWATLLTVPRSETSLALIEVTAFPISRRAWPPGVPVTTTSSSEIDCSVIETRTSGPPTVAVIRSGLKPMRRTSSVTVSPVTPPMRKRPVASVVVPSVVPATWI